MLAYREMGMLTGLKKLSFIYFSFALTSTGLSQESETQVQRALLSESHWASPRASSMAGAISPIAEGLDASYYNPAGVGGITKEGNRPAIHRLYFPYFSTAVNNNTIDLSGDISQASNLEDPVVIEQILNAFDNQRQYGRFSIVPSITFFRTQLSYVFDTQVAAAAIDSSRDQVDLESRTVTGPSIAFSFANGSKTFSFGLFAGFFNREETAGEFSFVDLNNPETRPDILKSGRQTYEGTPIHTGINWVIGKKWRPSLAIAFKNVGGTKYRNKNTDNEDIKVAEDLTLGFSTTPKLGKWGHLSFVTEAHELSNSDKATSKKLRAGLEFNLGSNPGNRAGFSLRSGYNSAGASFGLGMNLGLIGINAASFAEDVGVNNKRVIERRFVLDFAVNVADF